jgi:Ca2+-binding RTX toxin-like protein
MFTAGRAKEYFVAGSGADRFVFNAVMDSPKGAKHDVIFNFSGAAGDKIDLHHILPAGAHLVFIGTDTFSHYHSVHPGVIGMVRFNPGSHQLQATVDGDFSAPDLAVSLPGVTTFHAGELILV